MGRIYADCHTIIAVSTQIWSLCSGHMAQPLKAGFTLKLTSPLLSTFLRWDSNSSGSEPAIVMWSLVPQVYQIIWQWLSMLQGHTGLSFYVEKLSQPIMPSWQCKEREGIEQGEVFCLRGTAVEQMTASAWLSQGLECTKRIFEHYSHRALISTLLSRLGKAHWARIP